MSGEVIDELAVDEIVRIPKAAELVARGLRARILSGELPEGAPLPPEGQLFEQFRVARTTVREAIRILESEGLLVVRRGAGGGARVWAPSEGRSPGTPGSSSSSRARRSPTSTRRGRAWRRRSQRSSPGAAATGR